jgi:hypothetical protein
MLDLAPRSNPEEWFSLWWLYEAIHNESIKPRFTLNAVGDLLKQEFAALVEALGPKLPETQKEVERRRNERLRTFGMRPKSGTHF